VQGLWAIRWLLAAVTLLQVGVLTSVPCRAADVGAPAPPVAAPAPVLLPNSYRYEVRFGAFAHGVGGVESGTVDLNGEFVFPRLPFAQDQWWNFFIPRPHVGGMVNLSGRTSYVYGGALWTIPLWQGIFAEGFFDGAVHDGSRFGTPTQAALGCNPLFHAGGSLGYALTQRWSVMFTFDHISNGNNTFGTDCVRNQGLNNYGGRIGFSF